MKGGDASQYAIATYGGIGHQTALPGGGNLIAGSAHQCGGTKKRKPKMKKYKYRETKNKHNKKKRKTSKRGGGIISGLALPALFYTSSELIKRGSLGKSLSKLGLNPK